MHVTPVFLPKMTKIGFLCGPPVFLFYNTEKSEWQKYVKRQVEEICFYHLNTIHK